MSFTLRVTGMSGKCDCRLSAAAADQVREVAGIRRVESQAAGVQGGEVEALGLRAAELVGGEVLASGRDVRLLVRLVRGDLRRLLVADLLRLVHARLER